MIIIHLTGVGLFEDIFWIFDKSPSLSNTPRLKKYS